MTDDEPRLTDFRFKDWRKEDAPRSRFGYRWVNTENPDDVRYQAEKPGEEVQPAETTFEEWASGELSQAREEVEAEVNTLAGRWEDMAEGVDLTEEEYAAMEGRVRPVKDMYGQYKVEVRDGGVVRDRNPTPEEAAYVIESGGLDELEQALFEDRYSELENQYESEVSAAARKRRRAERLEEQQELYRRVREEGERTYVRFGDVPKGGRSYNYMDDRPEAGVSVYPAYRLPDGSIVADLTHGGLSGSWFMLSSDNRPLYEVEGEVLDELGSDGEPLLGGAGVVGDVNDERWEGALTFPEDELNG